MSKFQDITNKPGVEVLWVPPSDRDWRDEFVTLANKARETTWGFTRDLKIQLWLVQQLEAAQIKLEAAEGLEKALKGQQLANGRLKAKITKMEGTKSE